jgi:hypothetical protein
MMNLKDVDPKIKRLFPWTLFLALAVVLCMASMIVHARGADLPDVWACYGPARDEAMAAGMTPCNQMSNLCVKVREFLASGHTIEEGRALAEAKHFPKWIIARAEKCVL